MRDVRILIACGLFFFAIAVYGQRMSGATDLQGLPYYAKASVVGFVIVLVMVILMPVINRIWPRK